MAFRRRVWGAGKLLVLGGEVGRHLHVFRDGLLVRCICRVEQYRGPDAFASGRIEGRSDAVELDRALEWFAGRQRRFGMTSEQLTGPTPVADAA